MKINGELNDQFMGDEYYSSVIVGLFSDERDTSFIIMLSIGLGLITYELVVFYFQIMCRMNA